MCSLSASPVPTPSTNRPSHCTEAVAVAVAWATIAGWIRIVGQVTAVLIGRDVTSDSAPITDHTNGLCPKPACSASRACRTSSCGPNSSQDKK
jgi:hypothetical protein